MELHVIFGAGQIGTPLAEMLLAAGKQVRLVKRSSSGFPLGVEALSGDAADLSFCHNACSGASVVYHCMNPEYSARIWEVLLPRYMDNLVAAAGNVGARLVVLDNLFMLGKTDGRPMNEDTPANPCSKKGEIRASVAQRLFDAHRQGRVQAVCGRAADFYGPGGRLTLFGDFFWKPVLSGKAAMMPANQYVAHTYHYIPDVARSLATLGCANELSGNPLWMLPCQPVVTTRELACRFDPHLGREIRIKSMPHWLLKPRGIVMPMMRELAEMTYQWDEPFVVDDSRFRANFDLRPAQIDEAAKATLEWARSAYLPR